MKNLSLLFIALLLLNFATTAQQGWFEQTSGTTVGLNSMAFVNNDLGWVVGGGGTIIKTTDGGENWIPQVSGTNNQLSSVIFIDLNTGWAVGDGGIVLNTTDAGLSWNFQVSGTTIGLNDVTFVDSNNGWAIGGNLSGNYYEGVIIRTTDGGDTWLSQVVSSSWYYSISFYDASTGWVTGTSVEGILPNQNYISRIYKTTNGGTDWEIQDTLDWHRFKELCFIDELNGWVSAHQGGAPNEWTGVYRTTNGGNDWNLVFEPGYGPWPSISFVDNNNGWFVTGTDWFWFSSRIFHTTNGGTDWTQQDAGGAKLGSIYFVDNITGWALGSDGTILKTTTGGVVSVEEEEIGVIPTEYILSNNFPNPFNPTTKIKYSISQTSNVVIKVFDILGNEIETLVNEEKSMGIYEITWYASNLPSGVYFYRIQAGDFVETKKMVLMK